MWLKLQDSWADTDAARAEHMGQLAYGSAAVQQWGCHATAEQSNYSGAMETGTDCIPLMAVSAGQQAHEMYLELPCRDQGMLSQQSHVAWGCQLAAPYSDVYISAAYSWPDEIRLS